METLSSYINVQVDAKDKETATSILKDLGLNMSTFINIAIKQVIKKNGIPFEVVNPEPSKELLEALKEVNEMVNNSEKYPRYSNSEDLKKALFDE